MLITYKKRNEHPALEQKLNTREVEQQKKKIQQDSHRDNSKILLK